MAKAEMTVHLADFDAVKAALRHAHAVVERHQEALDIIESYGQIDGDHHKAWVIDRVLRVLTGPEYDAWVTDYEQAGEYVVWDEGIAP